MIDVIVHAKALLHQFGYPRTGPQIGIKARRLCPFEQQRFQSSFVSSAELWWSSRCRLGPHSSFASSSRRCLPTAHAAPIHTNTTRYLRGQQSVIEQRQRPQAPTLQFL